MALKKKYAYYIDRGKLAIVEFGGTSNDSDTLTGWQSVSTAGKTVRLFTKGLAAPITTASDKATELTTAIPSRYHQAIISLAISYLYLRPDKTNAEMYALHKREYMEMLKRAKRWKKMGRRTTGFIKPVDF
tara:strand:+ start:1017 stop:1409 length:393 start_codon:yes stop_codon:yes gene_type:complete